MKPNSSSSFARSSSAHSSSARSSFGRSSSRSTSTTRTFPFSSSTGRKLILAEKPQVARDVAKALGVTQKANGVLHNDRFVVTWCIGHLVELCEPHEYDPAWKRWSLHLLPMLPAPFKLRPIRKTIAQWQLVKRLLRDRSFSSVINACDAGREGELIFRLCYELAGCVLPVERLWISSLTQEAITQGIGKLRSGKAFDDLAQAARCRSEADWLVGMNATRAVTIWRNSQRGVLLSVGRVQTPTLALLVEREKQIVEFVPVDYFEVQSNLRRKVAPNDQFIARWQFGKTHRLATRTLADRIVSRDKVGMVSVENIEEKRVREPPPLLFDLTSLQRTCNRRFGFSAQQTLSIAQQLYEEHKLLSYPRTDSRHLSKDLFSQLPEIFSAVGQCAAYSAFSGKLGAVTPPARVFQDHKVTDHHAIIPTTTPLSSGRLAALTRDEKNVLDLVIRRFLGVFFPDAEFAQTRVTIKVDAGVMQDPQTPETDAEGRLTAVPPPPDRYVAQGKRRIVAGWQEVAGFSGTEGSQSPKEQDSHEREDDAEWPNQVIPSLHVGEVLVGDFLAIDKKTKPPPRFSEATLLSAMEQAGKGLSDAELRHAMKDTGLGTPATRATIIETLLKRQYIERQGRQLHPTCLGQDLIRKLPDAGLASAEWTGKWEARLCRMARGEETAENFMSDIAAYVRELVSCVRALPNPERVDIPKRAEKKTTRSQARSTKRQRTSQPSPGTPLAPSVRCPRCQRADVIWGKQAWGCANFRECTFRIPFVVGETRLSVANVTALLAKGSIRLTRKNQKLALRLNVVAEPPLAVTPS